MTRAAGSNIDPYWSDVQGLWLLDEAAGAAGTLADSKNSYDMTAGNMTMVASPARFSDNSMISTSDNDAATTSRAYAAVWNWFNKDCCIDMWFYPVAGTDGATERTLVAHATTAGILNWALEINETTFLPRMYWWTGSGNAMTPSTALTVNTWNHFCFQWDDSENKAYFGVNGVLEEETATVVPSTDAAQFRIGGSNSTKAMPGNMGSIRWTDTLRFGTGATYTVPSKVFPTE